MPRPRRSRRAPAQPADTASAEPEAAPERGRARVSGHKVETETQEAPRRSTRRGRKTSVEAPPSSAAEQGALQKASDARDSAMQRLALEDVMTTSDAATSEANKMDAEVELGRKAHATPLQQQQPQQQRRDTTGLDLDDEMFAGLDDSLDLDLDLGDDTEQQAPPSGQRSTDTSSMTTGFLKRRGRAPSVSLHGNDSAAIRPSSRAGGTPAISSSFNIGAFRRRQREPSILGTGRKARADSPAEEGEAAAAAAVSDDDEDDFAPEAESTPLNRRRTQPAEVEAGPEAEPEAETEPKAGPSTRSRKRKSTDVPEGSDRPEKASRLEGGLDVEAEVDAVVETEIVAEAEREVEAEEEAEAEMEAEAQDETPHDDTHVAVPPDDSDNEDENDGNSSDLSSLPSLSSPQLPPTRFPARPVTPINQTELMAPPESSGSEDEEIWPDLRAAVRRKRHGPVTPLRDGNVSDMSSPPSLTHSPNLPPTRQRTQRKQKGKASPRLTTASLTGLLPRRRHRTRDGDDESSSDAEVDGSGLAQDEDELSHLDTRPSRRRAKTTPRQAAAASAATNRPGSRGGRAATKSSPVVRRTVKRTYSRRSSDKENRSEDDDDEAETGLSPAPDDTFDAGEGDESESVAEELRNAVKKFAEVDRWEMEFEEMTQSSSPSGAR